jgi:hypothetical protein
MGAARAERIELAVDAGAAATFAAAAGWSLLMLSGSTASAVGGFGLALFSCGRILRGIGAVKAALLPPAAAGHGVQALLAEADRLSGEAPAAARGDELVLDDVLAGLGPDCRVVRLFDPAAMPTAGELKDRIDRHLDDGAACADDSQALHDALAELRRSLR